MPLLDSRKALAVPNVGCNAPNSSYHKKVGNCAANGYW